MTAKILLLDTETSLMSVATFSLWDEAKSHNNILQDWYMICAAWKWLGQKKVYAVAVTEPMQDKEVVQALRDAIAEADIVIHHNGDAFDLKKLNARMILHDIPPFPHPISIDTLKVARKEFKFTSNRLDYLGKALGCGGKITNKPGMWMEILKGDLSCIPLMLKYNKRDVTLLEEVYLKLRPYMRNHPDLNMFSRDASERFCSHCSSSNVQKRGYIRKKTGKYQRYQCQDCGAWSADGKAIKDENS